MQEIGYPNVLTLWTNEKKKGYIKFQMKKVPGEMQ